jgi:hypothetical protein
VVLAAPASRGANKVINRFCTRLSTKIAGPQQYNAAFKQNPVLWIKHRGTVENKGLNVDKLALGVESDDYLNALMPVTSIPVISR